MKSKLILALAISLGILSACDSDTHTPEFDGVGDIYVRCQKIDDVVKYAPVIYAYSNMYLSSAKMSHSDADSPEITLTKVGENATNFASLPKIIDYSEADVKNGTYNFQFTSTDNEVLNLTDELLEVRIAAIEISKFDYNKDQHKIEIEWGTVENRDAYHVKIATKVDGQIVYSSSRLNNNSLIVTPTSSGWNKYYTMKADQIYTVSVSAYKFENSNTQNGYHINQESVAYETIEW